jgi:hypothetical protein
VCGLDLREGQLLGHQWQPGHLLRDLGLLRLGHLLTVKGTIVQMSRGPVTPLAMMIRYDYLSSSVIYLDLNSDVVVLFTKSALII